MTRSLVCAAAALTCCFAQPKPASPELKYAVIVRTGRRRQGGQRRDRNAADQSSGRFRTRHKYLQSFRYARALLDLAQLSAGRRASRRRANLLTVARARIRPAFRTASVRRADARSDALRQAALARKPASNRESSCRDAEPHRRAGPAIGFPSKRRRSLPSTPRLCSSVNCSDH